jgi:RimJ/RimL family protein N-acetyltransferase
MFVFTDFAEGHISLFQTWLAQDHVKPYWQESDSAEEIKKKFLVEFKTRSVYPYVIEYKDQIIGYIQYYNAYKIGDGWWENEKPGTFGIDLMIGDPNFVGKGFGVQIIKEFVAHVRSLESAMSSVIIDPEPKNKRAIKVFEKAGFVVENEIITPNGPAVLMRMKL